MSSHNRSLASCTEDCTDSKITVKRDGRRATFDNFERSMIKRIDIDRWIRTTDIEKADYILAKPGVADVIIELKGKDLKHATQQIVSTLARWKGVPPYSERLGGLIVFTRCPMSTAEVSDFKKRLLIKHEVWLVMDKDQKTEYRFERFRDRK
jgi:hypothetical protein